MTFLKNGYVKTKMNKINETHFQQLKTLKIADIKNGVWVYHDLFKKNFRKCFLNPLNQIKQRSTADTIKHLIKNTPLFKSFRGTKKVRQLAASYYSFEYHLKQTYEPRPENFNQLLYAIWYLNDHKPKVIKNE